jgi:hypothetical protein
MVYIGFVGAIVGALIAGVATYLTTRYNMQLQIQHSYDQTLRDKRLERYQELFYISRCLPRYCLPDEEPERKNIRQFRQEFHDWYFSQAAGGMFLSPMAKDHFMRVLNMLVEVGFPEGDREIDSPLSATELTTLHELASELRHQLAADVGAAQPAV